VGGRTGARVGGRTGARVGGRTGARVGGLAGARVGGRCTGVVGRSTQRNCPVNKLRSQVSGQTGLLIQS
jgi:hypothetical protein